MDRLEKQRRSMRTNNFLENTADLAVFFLLDNLSRYSCYSF